MPAKVTITLQKAVITRKEEQFKTMDPWAVVMFEGQKKITKPITKGNLNPEFNQAWTFQRSADVKIQISLFKKEMIFDAKSNEKKETDLLIGKGTLNVLSTLKKAVNKPLPIVIDLYYDFDDKTAGQANLTVQFIPGAGLEDYRNQLQEKQLKEQYSSQVQIKDINLTLTTPKQGTDYYIKVRGATQVQTQQKKGSASMKFEQDCKIYLIKPKIVYFDVQEILKDEFDRVIGDELVGICMLELEKSNNGDQNLPVKSRGKPVGSLKCNSTFDNWEKEVVEEEEKQEESVLDLKLSNDELKNILKKRQKKDKFWLSPERFSLDLQLKKTEQLEKRSMLMKSHHKSLLNSSSASANSSQMVNSSSIFIKNEEKNLKLKKDIVISTTTVKLPKLKTNNHVEVPTQFNKQYFRDIHGLGFSSIESSSTLQSSVLKYSIPESKRFQSHGTISPGPGSYCTSGVVEDSHNNKKFQIPTALSEVRTTKRERAPRVNVDTGLKSSSKPK